MSSKDLEALEIEVPGASPSQKYFLIRLLYLMGEDGMLSGTTKELASRIGVSVSTCVEAGKLFVANRYLVREKAKPIRGRPALVYRVGIKLNTSEAISSNLPEWQAGLVRFLLHSDSLDSRSGLTTGDRMIIALLILSANSCGVVDSLSHAGIAKRTGLARSTLKEKISLYLQLGIIRRTIPGFKGSRLFGTVPSVHFMNLGHPLYGPCKVESTAIINYGYWTSYRTNSNWPLPDRIVINRDISLEILEIAEARRRLAEGEPIPRALMKRYSRLQPQVMMESRFFFDDVLEFFKPSENVYITAMLQARIEGYASYLLSNYWDALAERLFFRPRVLRKTIKDHVKASISSLEGWPSVKARRKLIHLTHFLLEVSWLIAGRYQKLIESAGSAAGWRNCRFVIMPSEASASNLALQEKKSKKTGLSLTQMNAAAANARMPGSFVRLKDIRMNSTVLCFQGCPAPLRPSYLVDHYLGYSQEPAHEFDLTFAELFKNGLLSVNQTDSTSRHLTVDALLGLRHVLPTLK